MFKVGDKVEIINASTSFFQDGDIGIIKMNDGSNCPYGVKCKGGIQWFRAEQLKLVESKTTKKQRITALENEASDLGKRTKVLEQEVSELKLIVEQLRKPSTVVEEALANVENIIEFEGKQYKKVDREAREGDVVIVTNDAEETEEIKTNKPYKVDEHNQITGSTHPYRYKVYVDRYNRTPETVDVYELIMEDKQEILPPAPKTQNELRAEIIEKAKGFLEEAKVDLTFDRGRGYVVKLSICDVDFIVNEEKRTVVALLRWKLNHNIKAKGIAKCNPSDVFNEHIGKAIALGRALGLDVSEFEQAVQPTLAIGQIVKFGNVEARLIPNSEIAYHDNRTARVDSFFSVNGIIINDTHAIYETAVNE